MLRSFFSLRKPRKVFRVMERRFRRQEKKLDTSSKEAVIGYLQALRESILQNKSAKARKMAEELLEASERLMPRSFFDRARDFSFGVLGALFVAVLIRTMWFELYVIPTGSMRPTLKEEDYLVVSKTDYGINVPLQLKHFYFDPKLVQRGSIVVFNGGGLDMRDVDTVYFYLFPGKKQFVKRLIGKPGDTLYFYGGDIYGVDRGGVKIEDFQREVFQHLEHIPFIRFEGKTDAQELTNRGYFIDTIFYQMNEPVAKLTMSPLGKVYGKMLKPSIPSYSDLWGMKHYAMARLLSEKDLEKFYPIESAFLPKGLLYLELKHHPSLQNAKMARDEYNRLRPTLSYSTSIIPLEKNHLDRIAQHMGTCRFKVKNNLAWRYGHSPQQFGKYLPKFPHVPDGTYEISDGKVFSLPFPSLPIIGLFTNGFTKLQSSSHPLLQSDPDTVYKLFNLGIEWASYYLPKSSDQPISPSRYAYFKNGDLYLMGSPILLREDPALKKYYKREEEKRQSATTSSPYFPFIQEKEPTKEEILRFGIKVPEGMYLVLGDNHAMSADSREFGFVPENNLKGGVSGIFAPLGDRMGAPIQPHKPFFTLTRITVWAFFGGFALLFSLYYRRKLKKRVF